MAKCSEVMGLREKSTELESQNLNLQNDGSYIVERIVETPPPDYQELKNKCRASEERIQYLQKRCKMLEHVLCYSEISPMSQIIKEYRSMSTFYLQQLSKEIEIYRASAEEYTVLLDFLEYLRSVTGEVEEMLLVED